MPKRRTTTIGRPTLYTDGCPGELVRQARDGKSVVQFCASQMIARKTFYLWLDNHPEFAEAEEIAKQLRESYWDEQYKICAIENKGNATMLKFYGSIRFGHSERSVVDNTSSDGSMSSKPVTINMVGVGPDEAPDTTPSNSPSEHE